MIPTARRTLKHPPSVALFALGAVLAFAGHAAAADVVEISETTRARSSASSTARSQGETYQGHVYAVARTSGDWVQVQFDDGKAWLRKSDLRVRDGVVKRVTASSGLRVRSGAGANHRALGTLPHGAEVADRGGSAVWRKISFGGKNGWISARFLRTVERRASSAGIAAVIEDPDASAPAGGGSSTTVSDDRHDHADAPASSSSRHIAWENGRRLGPIDVVMIDGKPVSRRTADAYKRMREAARRDGVTLRVNSGFRTYEHQAELYRLYLAGRGNLAAPAGHSNHQNGLALDLNTSDRGVYRWLTRNAARFGFKRTVPSEKWHWELRG